MKRFFPIRALCFALLLAPATALQAGPFDPVVPAGDTEAQAIAKAAAHRGARQFAQAIEILQKALAKNPDSARLHYHLGLAYMADGKLDLAEARFRTVIQEDQDFPEAHIQLARLAVRKVRRSLPKDKNLGFIESAIRQLQQAIKKMPQSSRWHYEIASLYMKSVPFREQSPETGFTEALKVLEEARRLEPDEVRPHFALGDARQRYADFLAKGKPFRELKGSVATRCSGLLDQAVADFRKALTINPRHLPSLERIAAIQYARGDAKQAVKIFQDHLDKLDKPIDRARCYRSMGQYLMRDRNYSEAEAKLRAAIKAAPREYASYLLLAEVLRRRSMNEEAAKVLEKALTVTGNFLNAHIELAMLRRREGRIKEAIKHLNAALNLAPRRAVFVSPPGKRIQNALANLYLLAAVQLGDIHVSRAEWDEAIRAFRRLGEVLPGSPLPEFHLGEVYRRKGDAKSAREHYTNALTRDKTFVRARIALAEVELGQRRFATTPQERAKVLQTAVYHYRRALELRPNNALVLDRLAGLLVSLARAHTPKDRTLLEQALAHSRRAVELAPASWKLRRRLALIHHELGNTKEAVAELTKLIDDVKALVQKNPDRAPLLFLLADLRATLHSWQPDDALRKQIIDGLAATIKKQPDFLEAYRKAATVLEHDKQYARSAEWFKKLYQVARGDASLGALPAQRARFALHAAAELAWIYTEYLPDLKQARKYARIALELDPELPSLLDTMGWILYREKKYADAVLYLRRAYKAVPTNATVGYHLAAALHANGNPQRALDVLRETLRNVGDDAELKAKLDKLKRAVGG